MEERIKLCSRVHGHDLLALAPHLIEQRVSELIPLLGSSDFPSGVNIGQEAGQRRQVIAISKRRLQIPQLLRDGISLPRLREASSLLSRSSV
jgi:hypothetical protein